MMVVFFSNLLMDLDLYGILPLVVIMNRRCFTFDVVCGSGLELIKGFTVSFCCAVSSHVLVRSGRQLF